MLEHGMMRSIGSTVVNNNVTQVFQLGSTASYTSSTDGTNLLTETAFNPAADIPTDGTVGGNNYSGTTGYVKGGWNVAGSNTVSAINSGLRFSTGTAVTFANLVIAHTYAGRGANFTAAGYTAGGGANTAGGVYNFINKIVFSNDTNINTTATLSATLGSTSGVTNKLGSTGYFLGGLSGSTRLNTIIKFIESTETPTTLVNTLSSTKNGVATGIETDTKGYMHGGYDGTVMTNVVETVAFSTETATLLGVTLAGVTSYLTVGGSYTKFLVYKTTTLTTPISVYLPATDTDTASAIALQTGRQPPHACNY